MFNEAFLSPILLESKIMLKKFGQQSLSSDFLGPVYTGRKNRERLTNKGYTRTLTILCSVENGSLEQI